jgi:anthranilate/para-aminobenzoate synthase component I
MSKEIFSPLFKEIPFESPDVVYRKLQTANSFLLESVKGPAQTARYSFVGFEPYLIFKVKDGIVGIEFEGKKTVSSRRPLSRLQELLQGYKQHPIAGLPPFQGGAVGMFAYDFVQYFETLPKSTKDDLFLPEAHFFMIDRLVAFDHLKRKSWIIVCPGVRKTALGYSEIRVDKAQCTIEAEEVLNEIAARIEKNALSDDEGGTTSRALGQAGPAIEILHDTGKGRYMAMVKNAKEYIAAGDIFQANLSLRLSAEIGGRDPWRIYEVLREINPSPFACFIDFGGYQIAGSSPERLVRVRESVIDTRPIAGTRPRGDTPVGDEAMRAELLLNEKERAEHIMLIDLERNDIGKVSDYGTVRVDELMVTEDYSHVMHIVSNVMGHLAAGKDCFDVIRATFPGGTITGVPKVRCMEIIDEIEPLRRGPYTGSIGYVGFNGTMDLNIVIRTFVIKDGKAYIQAGAGIVADSDPEREYMESLKKAEALMRTLERI